MILITTWLSALPTSLCIPYTGQISKYLRDLGLGLQKQVHLETSTSPYPITSHIICVSESGQGVCVSVYKNRESGCEGRDMKEGV